MLKVKEYTEEDELQQKLLELEEQLQQTRQELAKTNQQNKELESILLKTSDTKKSKIITIRGATKIDFVNINDIIYCMADEAYTRVILINDKTIVATKPLTTFEQMLNIQPFFRVNKSCLINTDYIVAFYKDRNQLLLQGDILIDVARRRRVDFLKMLDR
ncbi:MAG: LytR/AlgR family response regulator transcription factor [Flavobacteriales bacterium]